MDEFGTKVDAPRFAMPAASCTLKASSSVSPLRSCVAGLLCHSCTTSCKAAYSDICASLDNHKLSSLISSKLYCPLFDGVTLIGAVLDSNLLFSCVDASGKGFQGRLSMAALSLEVRKARRASLLDAVSGSQRARYAMSQVLALLAHSYSAELLQP